MACFQSAHTSVGRSLWIRSCGDRNCSRLATVRLGIGTLIANILVQFKVCTGNLCSKSEVSYIILLYHMDWFYRDLRRIVPVLAQPVWNTARIGQRRSTTTITYLLIYLLYLWYLSINNFNILGKTVLFIYCKIIVFWQKYGWRCWSIFYRCGHWHK